MDSLYSLDDELALAVFLEDLEEVKALLARGASPDARDEAQRTALIAAVKGGHRELVGLLLTAGADPNACDTEGSTALHVAAQRRDLPTVWALLRHGADVNARDEDGRSVLWRALLGCAGRTAVVELLRQQGARDDAPCGRGLAATDVARKLGVALRARSHAGNN